MQGDADGAVQISTIGTGFQVSDNGVVVSGSTPLTGVNNIQIKIDQTAGADNTVSLDLGTASVNNVYANLGNGGNTFSITGGTAKTVTYQGGTGADDVTLTTPVTNYANVRLGDGANSLTVNGNVGNLGVKGGSDKDAVTIASTASIAHNVFASLGAGDNTFDLDGSVTGHVLVKAGEGADTVTLADVSSVGKSVWALPRRRQQHGQRQRQHWPIAVL